MDDNLDMAQTETGSNTDRRNGPLKNGPLKNAMSIDVEDYFQVWALSEKIAPEDWDGFDLRVDAATRAAMDLMERHQVTATFFTLGWVAQKCPALIREIIARGHELASHGMAHKKIFDQSREEFVKDAGDSKKRLEDIAGVKIRGFRAAGFSLDARSPWAHEVLHEAGYDYSSSIHPIAHDHYDNPNASRLPFHPIVGSDFLEIPVATVSAFGRRLSCAGGGWFRVLPYGWTKHLLTRLNEKELQPGVFYFHPWEIDPDQPKVEGLSAKSKFRHYTNLDKMSAKLERLFQDFKWSRLDALYLPQQMKDAA